VLLERLRVCGSDALSDPAVRAKCKTLFLSWSREYGKSQAPSLQRIAALSKELPQRKQRVTQNTSKVIRETDPFAAEEDNEDVPTPSSSKAPQPLESSRRSEIGDPSHSTAKKSTKEPKKKDKKSSHKKSAPFNLEAEKEIIKQSIGDSSIASANLLNALRLINREQQKISENEDAVRYFENCKALRRKVLRYVSLDSTFILCHSLWCQRKTIIHFRIFQN
jgi:hypothetical protein